MSSWVIKSTKTQHKISNFAIRIFPKQSPDLDVDPIIIAADPKPVSVGLLFLCKSILHFKNSNRQTEPIMETPLGTKTCM